MNTAFQTTQRIDSTSSDDALLAAIAAGDRSAAGILYVRHAEALRQVAVSAVGKHDETIADDAVNDVFVVLLEGRAASFQPARGRALVWLQAIARSAALEHLRGRDSQEVRRKKRRAES